VFELFAERSKKKEFGIEIEIILSSLLGSLLFYSFPPTKIALPEQFNSTSDNNPAITHLP
jgi:hypothetical protein